MLCVRLAVTCAGACSEGFDDGTHLLETPWAALAAAPPQFQNNRSGLAPSPTLSHPLRLTACQPVVVVANERWQRTVPMAMFS